MKKILAMLVVAMAYQTSFSQTITSISEPKDTVVVQVPEPTAPAKERRDTRPMKDRFALGLGGAFWMNTSQTYLEIAPSLAYKFPKRLTTGVGYRYIYRHSRVNGPDLNAYGPNVFARLQLIKRVYFWTEYEYLTNEYEVSSTQIDKMSTDSWFVGLGYVRSIGKKGKNGISIQVLYNVLYSNNDNNPYYSPVTYRIGYYF